MYATMDVNYYSEVLLGRRRTWCTQRAILAQEAESGQRKELGFSRR